MNELQSVANEISVYTSISGGRDHPRDDGVTCLSGYRRFVNPRLNAKVYKVLSHIYVDGEVSVWVDGNIKLLVSPEELVSLMTKDVCVFRHWDRDCIYEEAKVCIRRRRDDSNVIQHQMEVYREAGFPEHSGLAACGVIMRRNTPQGESNE